MNGLADGWFVVYRKLRRDTQRQQLEYFFSISASAKRPPFLLHRSFLVSAVEGDRYGESRLIARSAGICLSDNFDSFSDIPHSVPYVCNLRICVDAAFDSLARDA
jgi:hypothetical protein